MTTVKSSQYGIGTIISEENGKATIDFNSNVKTLIVKFANLKNEDGSLFTGNSIFVMKEIKVNPYHKDSVKKTHFEKRMDFERKQSLLSDSEKLSQNIESWKNIALSVNNKWNQNSTWNLAADSFGKINANGNSFIESLLNSMFKLGKLSEKQAYMLAKFAVETKQLN